MKYLKFISLIAVCITIVFLSAVTFLKSPIEVRGSAQEGMEYYATTTDETWGVGSANARLLTSRSLKSGSLAQVTITTSGNNSMRFYDATTTATTTYVISGARTDVGTTTIAYFASTTPGTYTFDAVYKRGLVVELLGTNIGSSTITWR